MSRFEKLLRRVMSGEADGNITFDEVVWLLDRLGFEKRVRGSHHIFERLELKEHLNLQPEKNGKAKSYQVKQVRDGLKELLGEE